MGIDANEILSNALVGLVAGLVGWLGGKVSRFVAKVDRAEKDLDAVFPKIRAIECELKQLTERGACACQSVCANGAEATVGAGRDESYRLGALGDQPADDIVPA